MKFLFFIIFLVGVPLVSLGIERDLTNDEAAKKKIKRMQVAVAKKKLVADKRLLLFTNGKLKGAKSLESVLPKKYVLISSFEELHLIESKVTIKQKDIDEILKIDGIVEAQMDELSYAQRPDDVGDCNGPSCKAGKVEKFAKGVKEIANTAGNCKLADPCQGGKAKLWAQKAIDADLMKKKVKKLLVDKGKSDISANVSVVDTGFDGAQAKNFKTVGKIHTAPGVKVNDRHVITGDKTRPGYDKKPIIGDPNKDEGGHGTMVASTIAGANGLGVADGVSLAVYRVTEPGSSGSTSSAFLQMSAYKACKERKDPDGITIINMSWGSVSDEGGFKRDEDERVTKKLIALMAKKGCLIVKAAGNSNYRRDFKSNLDDSYLRVASVDKFHHLSYFSSKGEIAAPGSGVYVLESTTAEDKAEGKNRCRPTEKSNGPSPKRFVNGTSFAAPIAAGIASMMVRVLKASGKFKNLTPIDRIKLVNRILKASMIDGSINGLRAVSMAEVWGGESSPKLQSVAQLNTMMNAHYKDKSPCTDKFGSCQQKKGCELTMCFDLGRSKLALCTGNQLSVSTDLARTAIKNGFLEAAFRFNLPEQKRGNATTAGETNKLAVELYLKRIGFYNRRRYSTNEENEMGLTFIQTVMVPYFEHCKRTNKCNKRDVERMLEEVLGNPKVERSLEKGIDLKSGEDRGSAETAKSVGKLMSIGSQILGDKKVAKLLETHVNKIVKDLQRRRKASGKSSWLGDSPITLARILDQTLVQAPAGKFKTEVLALEKKLLLQQMKMNNYYEYKTKKPKFFLFELFAPTKDPARSSFDGMVHRHKDIIEAAIKAGDLSSLAPFQIMEILKKMDDVPEWKAKSKEILLLIFKQMSKGKGWTSKNDDEIFNATLIRLHHLGQSLGSSDRLKLKKELALLIENGSLGMLKDMRDACRNSWTDFRKEVGWLPLKGSKLNCNTHLLLDPSAVPTYTKKMAMLFIKQKDGNYGHVEGAIERVEDIAFDLVKTATKPSNSKIKLPAWGTRSGNRFQPPQNGPLEVDNIKRSDLLDQYFAALIEKFSDKKSDLHENYSTLSFFEADSYSLKQKEMQRILYYLPKNGKWKQAADSLIKKADESGSSDKVKKLAKYLKRFKRFVK
jgi:hypothetical protein